MITCNTFYANIYIGLREGYQGILHPIQEVVDICQSYCNTVKLGLTVTETFFVYVNGNEPGAIVGLINYPRFPLPETDIVGYAKDLAEYLKEQLKQERCSIVTPDITYMLGEQ